MGIYIPGMEMPADNTILIRIFPASKKGEYYVQQLDVDGDILNELWAIPIPEHGRLIDADEYKQEMKDCRMAFWDEVLDSMPTIVPAEEGE